MPKDEEQISKQLLTMKIHDKLYFDGFNILRVHKGWVYTFTKKVHCNGVGDQFAISSVFVPR